MAKRKTQAEKHEIFVDKVISKFGKEDYTILGTFINSETKIKLRHNVCDYEWDVTPSNFLTLQSKCPKCSKRIKFTTETFKERIFGLVGVEYRVLGEYTTRYGKIKMKHNRCGFEWEVAAYAFTVIGSRCPLCAGLATYTTERFISVIKELTGDEYIVNGQYKNNRTEIEMVHNLCGHIFNIQPTAFINSNSRCPECFDTNSKGNKRIEMFLEVNNINHVAEYTFEDLKYINLLRFDFAVFDNKNKLKLLIEFDGEQHYKVVDFFGGVEGFESRKRNDEMKNQYCRRKNIRLIRIPYWDFDNIDQILSTELNIKSEEIKTISTEEEKKKLKNNKTNIIPMTLNFGASETLEDEWEQQLKASSFLFVR